MALEITQELSRNFLSYAQEVNEDRAIPCAKSGLKPVARRILWGAYHDGFLSSKTYVKCAQIVGSVMASWHPHGDSSIYGALVRMSQPWVMRYPLIDFHGNMGSINGDGAAAYRYTNARLSKIAEDGMLKGLKKKVVDFIPNYDENEDEPITLPALFPNLLCNPNVGIGVARATHFLPHNLKEVGQAIFDYLDGKEPMLVGPDFPTGGIVINGDDIPQIMRTGRGSVKVRARYKIEKNNLVFYEIPYETCLEDLLKEIGEACEEQGLEFVQEVRDETNKNGVRIVLECKSKSNLEFLAQKLYASTHLQTSLSYNQVALVNSVPTELSLTDCIKVYVQHNLDCIVKETRFDLNEATARQEIVTGLLKALEDIDNIIALIKKSKDSNDARDNLIKTYTFSEEQAKAIVAMRLGKLANLEKIELQNEHAELTNKIEKMNALLSSEQAQEEELRKRLAAFIEEYGDERRTEICQIEDITKDKSLVEAPPPEEVVVILYENGNLRRTPRNGFKTQNRNGKGKKSEKDIIKETITTNTVDTLALFTQQGKMFKVSVGKVPESITPASAITKCGDEQVVAMASCTFNIEKNYAVFVTKNGFVKKTGLSEYLKAKKTTGIPSIKFEGNDSLVKIFFMNEENLMLFTKNGQAIRIDTSSINAIGRMTKGIKGIKLETDDEVIAADFIRDKDSSIAVFTKDGLGKRIMLNNFYVQGNNGKGIKYTKNDKEVIGVFSTDDSADFFVTGQPNSITVSAKDIPVLERTSGGNLLIKDSVVTKVFRL